PSFDQAVGDVGIIMDEGFDNGFVVSVEDQKSVVGGIGERARKDEFAAGVGIGNATQVLVAKGSATRDEIVDDIVEDGEVRHVLPPVYFRSKGKSEGERILRWRELAQGSERIAQRLKPIFAEALMSEVKLRPAREEQEPHTQSRRAGHPAKLNGLSWTEIVPRSPSAAQQEPLRFRDDKLRGRRG